MIQIERIDAQLTRAYQTTTAHASKYRRIYSGIAVTALIIGLVWSANTTDIDLQSISPLWVLVNTLVTAPIAIGLTALALCQCARMVGVNLAFRQSFKACCLGTASNILPIPAGSLVYSSALINRGGSVIQSNLVVVMANFAPLGCVLLFAGFALFFSQRLGAILVALPGFFIVFLAARFMMRHISKKEIVLFIVVAISRSSLLILRVFISFMAIGISIDIADATFLSTAAASASLVVVAPSGLGVGESIAALLSLATSIKPADAFIAISVNTLTALLFASVFSVGMLARIAREKQE